jgi:flagellar hook-basal body complex protein FliE
MAAGIGSILNAIGMSQPATAGATGMTDATSAAGAVAPPDSSGNTFTNMLDGLQASQDSADSLAVQAATGNLNDIHTYTIAASEAQLMTDLTVAVRDRAVESFNEIMRMQA